MAKHVDALTGREFNSEEEYLNHTSPVTGYKPTDPRHHGTRFLQQSKAALRRTGKLTKAREQEIDSQIEDVRGNNLDDKLMRAKLARQSRGR